MDQPGDRPVIFHYSSVPNFVADMLKWRRSSDPRFSIRAELDELPGCSPTLVTQVVKGSRRLTRDRVDAFGKLLNLTSQESRYLDQWVALDRRRDAPVPVAKRKAMDLSSSLPLPVLRRPQNHLISNWLHAYVKEACRLVGFSPDPVKIQRMLGGIASLPQVTKSLEFLLREGFLRRTPDGDLVQNELQNETTDEIPDQKVRAFHKRALDIAKRGIDLFSVTQRKSDAYILTVNDENLPKLRKIMSECMEQLKQFERDHADDNEGLYQVIVHVTPIGRGVDVTH